MTLPAESLPVPSVAAEGPVRCFHCGQPVPAGASYPVEVDGEARPMCCAGCQAVARTILQCGLGAYYRHRTAAAHRAEPLPPEILERFAVYDRPAVQQSFVRSQGELRETSLILAGITCAACVWLNERHVSSLPGVVEFRVNYSTHRAHLKWEPALIHLSDVLGAIAAIGYTAHPYDPRTHEALYQEERRQGLRRLGVAGLGMGQVMMFAVALYAGGFQGMDTGIEGLLRWASLAVATPVVAYSARPFFRGAWRDLRRGGLGMDVPVALAIGAAYSASLWATLSGRGEVYFDSVTMFTFFLLTARHLETVARHGAVRTMEALGRLLPVTANRLQGDREEVVAAADLQPGDMVLVRPGERIPADGAVAEGRSSVDESLITGESLPQPRGEGDSVAAGSVNREGPLTVRVQRVGSQTLLSSIVRLLDRAQTEKPRVAQLADQVAGWFVAAVLVLAAAVALWWWRHQPDDAFWVTLSVLVVTCPCALSLATPAALTAAAAWLNRRGLLVTRGHAVETLARATHVVLDKTGTLTEGVLRLAEVMPLRGFAAAEVLGLAAALEQRSEHPIAKAVLREAPNTAPALNLKVLSGEGVEGDIDGRRYRLGNPGFAAGRGLVEPAELQRTKEGATWVMLADDAGPLGWLAFTDPLRPDAADAVRELGRQGLELWLLSGDGSAVVDRVARAVGIAHAHGQLTPDAKLAKVQALQRSGGCVAMVGDGVNDAPVLAGAQVSIAMGGGADLAHASADMVLLSGNLMDIVAGRRTARRTVRVIRQNLAWALGYNLLALPLAAAGYVAPWMAALGMSMSSIVVVLNALRLKRGPGGERAQAAPAPGSGATLRDLPA
jgi:Cu2+-exporting ATPase